MENTKINWECPSCGETNLDCRRHWQAVALEAHAEKAPALLPRLFNSLLV